MKFILETADDAHLLDFGIPNKIQTYSTLRNWFVKVTQKALLLCSFPSAVIMIMLIIKPKDWPIGEQIAFCFMPQIVVMPFAWILSFMQGYLLPKRVKRRFDEISESAFVGFDKKEHGPGYIQLIGQDEEWHLEFYKVNNRKMIAIQAIYKSRIEGQPLAETDLDEKFKSFCEKRHATLHNKPLTRYVTVMPYAIRVTLPMRLHLASQDYRCLYKDLKAFVSSINCEIISVESYLASKR